MRTKRITRLPERPPEPDPVGCAATVVIAIGLLALVASIFLVVLT